MGYNELQWVTYCRQELTSRKDQAKYRAPGQPLEFMGIKSLAEAFERSPGGQARAEALASPAVPAPKAVVTGDTGDMAPFSTDPLVRTRYGLKNADVFKALVSRDLLLFSRNSFLYIFQEFQTTLVGIMAATLFLRTNMHSSTIGDGFIYMGLLFFTTLTAM